MVPDRAAAAAAAAAQEQDQGAASSRARRPDRSESAPSGLGYARLSPRPLARPTLTARSVSRGPAGGGGSPGPQPGCSAAPKGRGGSRPRGRAQRPQMPASARPAGDRGPWPGSARVAARAVRLAASQRRPPRPGRAAVSALLQRLLGLPRHVRGAVLKTRSPGKGGASAPPSSAPSGSHPSPTSTKPPTQSPPLWRGGRASFLPQDPPALGLWETRRGNRGTPQKCPLGWGTGKLIRHFSQPKAAAFRGEGRGLSPGKVAVQVILASPGLRGPSSRRTCLWECAMSPGVNQVKPTLNPKKKREGTPKRPSAGPREGEIKSQRKEKVSPKKREKGDRGAEMPISGSDHRVAQGASAQRCELRPGWVGARPAAPTALRLPTPASAPGSG